MASQHPDTHTEVKKAKARMHNGTAEIKEAANDLLQEKLDELKERSEDIRNLLSEYVKNKPLKSLGIALATGMAIAFFMKR